MGEKIRKRPHESLPPQIWAAPPEPLISQYLIYHILDIHGHRVVRSTLSKRIVYAAACIGTLCFGMNERLLASCRFKFKWLSRECGLDVQRELEWCEAWKAHRQEPHWRLNLAQTLLVPEVAGKTLDDESIYEKCELCGSSIGWSSAVSGMCRKKHLFGTALSFPEGLIDDPPGLNY